MDTEKMVKKGKYWVYESGWYKDRLKIIKEEKPVEKDIKIDEREYKFKKY